jgi:adenylosuccinate lyase
MIERYTRPQMAAVWDEEAKLGIWLEVELLACEALAQRDEIPHDVPAKLRARARVNVQRMREIEREVAHDIIAFVTSVAEVCGPEGRYLHLGLTSSDVLDTSFAVQLVRAADLLIAGATLLGEAIQAQAQAHKGTVMVGRTHGIHAEPITFGLKLAIWYDELARAKKRLTAALETISVGKISGAVGTFAHLPPSVEGHVMGALGLKPAPASSQITAYALLATSIEKFATEIRHLQRTEVREAEEAFTPGQKGSSAMPHKRNPVLSENLTGLARLMRGYALSAMEDVPLWHERDISHSSVERVIGPDATVTLDFMLHRFAGLMENLTVYPENMKRNLALLGGVVHSQRLLLELARRGVDRQAAYVIVQRNAMRFFEQGVPFLAALLEDKDLLAKMSKEEVEACFSPDHHLKHVDEIFRRVFG